MPGSATSHARHKNQSAFLFLGDIYHVVIHLPLWGLLLLFVVVYCLSFLTFAAFWYLISEPCGIELETFRAAYYLSVETQMTIGYGVPDPYFRNCNEAIFVLLGQSLAGLVIDAMMIGLMFQHVSKAYTRASTVIFSNVAVLQVIIRCHRARAAPHSVEHSAAAHETWSSARVPPWGIVDSIVELGRGRHVPGLLFGGRAT